MPGFKRVHRGEGACNKPSTFVIPLKPVERGQEVDDRALQQVSVPRAQRPSASCSTLACQHSA